MSTVCVVGLGYIGLPMATMLASRGYKVVGCDINGPAVDSINSGRAHFFEPDLDMLLQAAIRSGNFGAQTAPIEADYFVIAVPTPFCEGHRPDLSYIQAATKSIAPFLKPGSTIILESTSPVGTTELMSAQLTLLRPELKLPRYKGGDQVDVFVAHCPERVLPGQTVRELTQNDRMIGGMTEECARMAARLYKSFVTGECILTDCRTAEFVKLIENSYRDVNIAFANELSLICERLGIDVWSAIELANRHPRVSILQPGCGVGGHCIAVDPWFIVNSAPAESRLIRTARQVNESKPKWVVEQILRHAERFKQPRIACFGLTYKADVEDIRESPAREIVEQLMGEDRSVLVCDPMLKTLPESLRRAGGVKLVGIDEAIREADIVALLVGHRSFRELDPGHFSNKIVIDAVGLLPRGAAQPLSSVPRLQQNLSASGAVGALAGEDQVISTRDRAGPAANRSDECFQ